MIECGITLRKTTGSKLGSSKGCYPTLSYTPDLPLLIVELCPCVENNSE